MSKEADIRLSSIKWLPWQARALRDILSGEHRGVAWAGGKGSGKSLLACAAATLICFTRPGAQVVLAMDTHRSLRDIHLPFLTQMLRGQEVEYLTSTSEWKFGNGSILRMRHLDFAGDPSMGGSPLEGPNLDAIIMDECQKVDARYFVTALERTRVKNGEFRPVVVFSGLPINTWWCRASLEKGWPVYRPKTKSNKKNLSEAFESDLRATYTETQARALLDGEELILEGAILKEYRQVEYPEGNIVPRDWKPNYVESRTMLSVDLGIRHPHALYWVEDLSLGAWVVTKEWAPDQATITELCQLMLRDLTPRSTWKNGMLRLPVDRLIIDPAGVARSVQTGNADADVWAMASPVGFGMRPLWEKDPTRRRVEFGLTRISLSLEARRLLFTGELIRSGMACDTKKRSLAKALINYRWDDKDKSRPYKDGFNDHAIDALNYGHREVMWDGIRWDHKDLSKAFDDIAKRAPSQGISNQALMFSKDER